MKEEFVTFEQAVKLKELGFDWKCFAYYTYLGNLGFDHPIEDILDSKIIYENFNDTRISELYSIGCSAPTLSQVQKWLRERHNIFTSVNIYFPNYKDDDYSFAKYGFVYIDRRNNRAVRIESDYNYNQLFDTYEEAVSGVIDKVLEILKSE